MKRMIVLLLVLVLILAGCKVADPIDIQAQQAENSGLTFHKIAVATYNIQDAQTLMFKEYLDGYIEKCFPDVVFRYSDSISNAEEMMNFLQVCADEGVEGILSFNSYDLKAEVEFCEKNKMYLIRPSSTASDDVFQSIASNPYFVGEIGPGIQAEYSEAQKLVYAMADSECRENFLIFSGGASMKNEMHRLRTLAFLEGLQKIYGLKLPATCEELAVANQTVSFETDGICITILPGYLGVPQVNAAAADAISGGKYQKVLSTVPVTPLREKMMKVDITCGVMDCFSEDNYFGFKNGKISYVAGKYQSEIGPAFVALYNAICGDPDLFRVDGKAFRLKQGFWTAGTPTDFDAQYALARGLVINAYNYQDLYEVVKSLNPDASFAKFAELVAGWSYEDCLARRS